MLLEAELVVEGGERWMGMDLVGRELEEQNIRALPRGRENIQGRYLDGREFWTKVGLAPKKSLLQ